MSDMVNDSIVSTDSVISETAVLPQAESLNILNEKEAVSDRTSLLGSSEIAEQLKNVEQILKVTESEAEYDRCSQRKRDLEKMLHFAKIREVKEAEENRIRSFEIAKQNLDTLKPLIDQKAAALPEAEQRALSRLLAFRQAIDDLVIVQLELADLYDQANASAKILGVPFENPPAFSLLGQKIYCQANRILDLSKRIVPMIAALLGRLNYIRDVFYKQKKKGFPMPEITVDHMSRGWVSGRADIRFNSDGTEQRYWENT